MNPGFDESWIDLHFIESLYQVQIPAWQTVFFIISDVDFTVETGIYCGSLSVKPWISNCLIFTIVVNLPEPHIC